MTTLTDFCFVCLKSTMFYLFPHLLFAQARWCLVPTKYKIISETLFNVSLINQGLK